MDGWVGLATGLLALFDRQRELGIANVRPK